MMMSILFGKNLLKKILKIFDIFKIINYICKNK